MYTKSIIRRKAYTKGEAISKYQNQDCIFVYNYRPSIPWIGSGLWYSMTPLSTTFQLYRGGQF